MANSPETECFGITNHEHVKHKEKSNLVPTRAPLRRGRAVRPSLESPENRPQLGEEEWMVSSRAGASDALSMCGWANCGLKWQRRSTGSWKDWLHHMTPIIPVSHACVRFQITQGAVSSMLHGLVWLATVTSCAAIGGELTE